MGGAPRVWDWRGGAGGGAALPRRPAVCISVTGGCGVGSLSLVGGGSAPGSVCSCDRPTAVWVGKLGQWGSRVSGRGMRVRRAALSRMCVHARCCRAWTPRARWRVRHWGSWLARHDAAVAISGVFPGCPRPRPGDVWRCFPLGLAGGRPPPALLSYAASHYRVLHVELLLPLVPLSLGLLLSPFLLSSVSLAFSLLSLVVATYTWHPR